MIEQHLQCCGVSKNAETFCSEHRNYHLVFQFILLKCMGDYQALGLWWHIKKE